MKVSGIVSMVFLGGGGREFTMVLKGKQPFLGASPPEAIGAVRGTRPNHTGCLEKEVIIFEYGFFRKKLAKNFAR